MKVTVTVEDHVKFFDYYNQTRTVLSTIKESSEHVRVQLEDLSHDEIKTLQIDLISQKNLMASNQSKVVFMYCDTANDLLTKAFVATHTLTPEGKACHWCSYDLKQADIEVVGKNLLAVGIIIVSLSSKFFREIQQIAQKSKAGEYFTLGFELTSVGKGYYEITDVRRQKKALV